MYDTDFLQITGQCIRCNTRTTINKNQWRRRQYIHNNSNHEEDVVVGGSGSEITNLQLQCKTSQPFWPASCTDLPTMIGQMALDLGHLMERQKSQLVGLDKAHSR